MILIVVIFVAVAVPFLLAVAVAVIDHLLSLILLSCKPLLFFCYLYKRWEQEIFLNKLNFPFNVKQSTTSV